VSVAGPARLDVEIDAPGRHFGEMFVPYSHDRSAYGRLSVPVVVVNGRPGPTLLVTAGIHGDEYEGQVALLRAAHALDPDRLTGRVILVPVANPPASGAARRTSPIDGVNLARCFPGKADGTPTEQLAEGLVRLLLPLADALLDFHSGGSTLDYLPCAFGRLPADRALARRTLDMLVAFGAPDTIVMTRPEASATLVSAALERGVVAMATELAGGGGVTPATVTMAGRGLVNVLAHLGMLERPAAAAAGTTRLLGVEPTHFLRAPGQGMFEPAFALGDVVHKGQAAGWLWNAERPERAPEELSSPAAGIVVCRRVPTNCAKADVLLHLAEATTADRLLG
jgi:predicted deacylase